MSLEFMTTRQQGNGLRAAGPQEGASGRE
jgi:hypothetical protein